MKKKFFMPLIFACALLCSCGGNLVPMDGGNIAHTESLSLSATELSLSVGGSAKLTAFTEVHSKDLVWNVSNGKVVSITQSGNEVTIYGKSAGKSNVSVIAGDKFATCQVTVGGGQSTVIVQAITFEESAKTLDVGETSLLKANVICNGEVPTLSWTVDNDAVASISRQDNTSVTVTGLSEGSTTVHASAGGVTANCTITVEDYGQEALSIRLDKSSLSLEVGSSSTLNATVNPAGTQVSWQSNDEAVATVNNGEVTALSTGTATISATVTTGTETKTATCLVNVKASGGDSDYEQRIASWSKPGHLYLHYLRTSDNDYEKWGLWIWQNYPHDSEGTLWGVSHQYPTTGVDPVTYGHMTNAECGGIGSQVYRDEYGEVIDVDLTREDLVGGRSGVPVQLVDYENKKFNKAILGFLIIDQTQMNGEHMWVSDGGAETFIFNLGKLLPDGRESYLHVYCVEGNVANFTTASGKQEFVNPTATDLTGAYRSHSDISNLKADAYPNGVATSTSFLDDRPGVGYQIFVPSFADSDGDGFGDIKGITEHLDYLDELGVDVLWLTPIQESNSYHGYDVTDYYKIDPKFGTLQDYQELIYKAHQRGMKVLMDMVINHTSKSNVLYKKSQRAEVETVNGKEINYRDMYLWKYKGDQIIEWDGVEGKYTVDNPASFIAKNVEDSDDWYRDGSSNYYYYGKFGSGMAELNYSSQATRDYMTDMCKYWLSFGLDGFRLDAIKHIYLLAELDLNITEEERATMSDATLQNRIKSMYKNDYVTYDVSYREYYNVEMDKTVRVKNDYTYDRDLNVMFWKQFAGSIKSAYPNCFLVGENFDGWDARIAPFYEAIDSQFDFSTYYHLNEMKPESIGSSVQHSLSGGNGDKGYYSYRNNAINGAFTSNHDVARMMNHAACHDASINSKYAGGDATHHAEVTQENLAYTLNQARYYAAVSILTPGVSWIYYGDEIGLTGNVNDKVPDSHGNIYDDHGNNVDRWYRQPMRWGATKGQDSVVNYTFGGVEVLWDKISSTIKTVPQQQADQNSLLNYFKVLCNIKSDPRYPTYGYIVNNGSISGASTGSYMQITDGVRTVRVRINNSDVDEYLGIPDGGTFLGGSAGATNQKIPAHGFHVIIA